MGIEWCRFEKNVAKGKEWENSIHLSFHPTILLLKNFILNNLKLLKNNPETTIFFSQPPFTSYKPEKNMSNFLTARISGPRRSIQIADHFLCTSAYVIYIITSTFCKRLYMLIQNGGK